MKFLGTLFSVCCLFLITRGYTLPKDLANHGTYRSICSRGGQYHADPYDCHYFVQCSNGIPYRRKCAIPLYWNQRLLTCQWAGDHCVEQVGQATTEAAASTKATMSPLTMATTTTINASTTANPITNQESTTEENTVTSKTTAFVKPDITTITTTPTELSAEITDVNHLATTVRTYSTTKTYTTTETLFTNSTSSASFNTTEGSFPTSTTMEPSAETTSETSTNTNFKTQTPTDIYTITVTPTPTTTTSEDVSAIENSPHTDATRPAIEREDSSKITSTEEFSITPFTVSETTDINQATSHASNEAEGNFTTTEPIAEPTTVSYAAATSITTLESLNKTEDTTTKESFTSETTANAETTTSHASTKFEELSTTESKMQSSIVKSSENVFETMATTGISTISIETVTNEVTATTAAEREEFSNVTSTNAGTTTGYAPTLNTSNNPEGVFTKETTRESTDIDGFTTNEATFEVSNNTEDLSTNYDTTKELTTENSIISETKTTTSLEAITETSGTSQILNSSAATVDSTLTAVQNTVQPAIPTETSSAAITFATEETATPSTKSSTSLIKQCDEGDVGSSTNCTNYSQCINGEHTIIDCPEDTFWNQHIFACTLNNSHCSESTTSKEVTEIDFITDKSTPQTASTSERSAPNGSLETSDSESTAKVSIPWADYSTADVLSLNSTTEITSEGATTIESYPFTSNSYLASATSSEGAIDKPYSNRSSTLEPNMSTNRERISSDSWSTEAVSTSDARQDGTTTPSRLSEAATTTDETTSNGITGNIYTHQPTISSQATEFEKTTLEDSESNSIIEEVASSQTTDENEITNVMAINSNMSTEPDSSTEIATESDWETVCVSGECLRDLNFEKSSTTKETLSESYVTPTINEALKLNFKSGLELNVCTGHNNEYHTVPYDCSKFIECVNGQANILSCPLLYYWNGEKGSCVKGSCLQITTAVI